MGRWRRILLAAVSLCCLTGCGDRYARQPLPSRAPEPSLSLSAAPTLSPEVTAAPTLEPVKPTETFIPVPEPPELEVVLTPPEAGEVWGTRTLWVEYQDEAGRLLFEGDLSLPYVPDPSGGYLAVEEYCREQMEERLAWIEEEMETIRDFNLRGYDLFLRGKISFSQGELALLTVYKAGWNGGAHRFYSSSSACFDLSTGVQLKLSDLFTDWEIAREKIYAELEAQTQEYDPDGYIFQRACEGLNSTDFYLDSEGLTIHYDEYEIAAYSLGEFEFLIPKEALVGLTAYPIWD